MTFTSKFSSTICLIVIVVIASCDTSKERENAEKIIIEIENLKTAEQKRNYLVEMHDEDQSARTLSNRAEQRYGSNSDEHRLAIQKTMALDDLNFDRIELYFKMYGYPTIANEGKDAAYTPLLIIHHTANDEEFERNFEILLNAYKTGNIQASDFCMLLDRRYFFRFGKRMAMKQPYRDEDRIELLIKNLNL